MAKPVYAKFQHAIHRVYLSNVFEILENITDELFQHAIHRVYLSNTIETRTWPAPINWFQHAIHRVYLSNSMCRAGVLVLEPFQHAIHRVYLSNVEDVMNGNAGEKFQHAIHRVYLSNSNQKGTEEGSHSVSTRYSSRLPFQPEKIQRVGIDPPKFQHAIHRVYLSNVGFKPVYRLPQKRFNTLFIASTFPTWQYRDDTPVEMLFQHAIHRVYLSNMEYPR